MTASSRPAPRPVVVTHALRTPIGKFMGSFSELSAADLGVSVVSSLLAAAELDPARVDELIFGNARQAGGGPNPARQISVRTGVPVESPAWTVNMACASGQKSLHLAVEAIQAGRGEILVVGGTESMTQLPYMLPKMRMGYRLGHAKVVDGMYLDGFLCPLAKMIMGETADKLAQDMGISREEQDEYALSSQHKSQAAREAGRFDDEIAPVSVPQRRGDPRLVEADEHPRNDAKIEGLTKLRPVFDAERGTVTAGNASGITDGAAALLVMGADKAEELGYEPLATVGAMSQAGVDPTRMGLGPVPAFKKLSEQSGLALADFDLIELNEAFAAQVLACHRELDLPMEIVNVNGGSISLGHPIGATGARYIVTLLHELRRRGGSRGLATLCVSGGLGLATAFERN